MQTTNITMDRQKATLYLSKEIKLQQTETLSAIVKMLK